jgi:hypothetical protein
MKVLIALLIYSLSVQVLKANTINCIKEPCELADSDNEPTNDENILNGNNQICTPNEVKMQDCNRCKCAPNGVAWFCTRNVCPPKESHEKYESDDKTNTTTDSNPKPTQCEPGTNWKEDCNSCWCTEHGRSACTLMACSSHEVSKRSTLELNVYSPEFKCEPNQSFTHPDGCNNCKCGPEGFTSHCTRKNCPVSNVSKRSTVDVYSPNFKCEPNKSFTHPDGCNNCKCGPEGSTLFCTKKMCPPVSHVSKRSTVDVYSSDFKCEPNKQFTHPDGCNTCHCNAEGKTSGCTEMSCIKLKKRSVVDVYSSDFKCEPNKQFTHPDGCNSCHCDTEGKTQFCTKMMCLPNESHVAKRATVDVYSSDFKCEPNKSFTHPDGCNNCKCSPEGSTLFCTKKMCETIESTIERTKRAIDNILRIKRGNNNDPASPDFSCEPKKSFKHKDGCNDCVCSEDGKMAACTLKLCIESSRRDVDVFADNYFCTPGESFPHPDGCNRCFCGANGHPNSCTEIGCREKRSIPSSTIERTKRAVDDALRIKRNSNTDPASLDFSCEPKNIFKHKDGCNECVCSEDGKLASCTFKICFDSVRRDVDVCTPGEFFPHPDGCNTCTCGANGHTTACTEIDCRNKRSIESFNCLPGASFKHPDGCNTCTCTMDGKNAACTLMLCPSLPSKLVVQENIPTISNDPSSPDFQCTPGSQFTHPDGCNSCTCSNDGKYAACTLKLCSVPTRTTRAITQENNPSAPYFRCTPGEQFSHADGCNTCICSTDGRTAACTLKRCSSISEATTALPIYSTTTPATERKKCVPGSRFMSDDGCNTCFCTNDGKVGCTLMYCGNQPIAPNTSGLRPITTPIPRPIQFPELRTKRETAKCIPGKIFKQDCNTCSCDEKGFLVCTKIACTPLGSQKTKRQIDQNLPHQDTSVPGFRCTPGSVFRDKCNMCRCTPQGLAACTDQLCPGF